MHWGRDLTEWTTHSVIFPFGQSCRTLHNLVGSTQSKTTEVASKMVIVFASAVIFDHTVSFFLRFGQHRFGHKIGQIRSTAKQSTAKRSMAKWSKPFHSVNDKTVTIGQFGQQTIQSTVNPTCQNSHVRVIRSTDNSVDSQSHVPKQSIVCSHLVKHVKFMPCAFVVDSVKDEHHSVKVATNAVNVAFDTVNVVWSTVYNCYSINTTDGSGTNALPSTPQHTPCTSPHHLS